MLLFESSLFSNSPFHPTTQRVSCYIDQLHPIVQFAAKRELPPSYTKPHDLQMLAQARLPGGLLDLRPTNVKPARSRRRGNLDFQPLEIYSDPKERRESSLCIGRSISLKRLEQGNPLPTSSARTPSPMMSWSISSKWNKVLPKCKSSLRATIT